MPRQIQRQINQEETFTACDKVALVISHNLEERQTMRRLFTKGEIQGKRQPPSKKRERQSEQNTCSPRPRPSTGDVCRDPAVPAPLLQSIHAPPADDRPGRLPGSPRVNAEALPADQAKAPDLEHTPAWELHPTFFPAPFFSVIPIHQINPSTPDDSPMSTHTSITAFKCHTQRAGSCKTRYIHKDRCLLMWKDGHNT